MLPSKASAPSDAERSVLRGVGYSDADIDAMSPKARAAIYADAVEMGVMPDGVEPTKPVSNIPDSIPTEEFSQRDNRGRPVASRISQIAVALVGLGAVGWAISSFYSSSHPEAAGSGCRKLQWHYTVDLGQSGDNLATALTKADIGQSCATMSFVCRNTGPIFSISLDDTNKKTEKIGPMIIDYGPSVINLNASVSDDGSAIRITDAKQVELAAHAIGDSFSVGVQVRFADGSASKAEFVSLDAAKALNPVLVACRLRRLPVDRTDDNSPGDSVSDTR